MRVSTKDFHLIFDERLNLKELCVKKYRASFSAESSYSLLGEKAVLGKVSESPNLILADVKTTQASGALRIKGGKRVSVSLNAEAGMGINEIGFRWPLPVETEILIDERVYTSKTPSGFEISLEPLGRIPFFLASFTDQYLRIGTKCRGDGYFPVGSIVKGEDGFTLYWKWEPRAPFPWEYATPEVYVEPFNSIDDAVDDYKAWMEKAFNLCRKEGNPRIPRWFHDTRLIIILDLWLNNGKIIHEYMDVVNLAQDLKKLGAPRDTIIYLTGWDGPYGGTMPEHKPRDELGGREKFKQMVKAVQGSGYRVMLHMTVTLMDKKLPVWRRFEKYNITDAYGRKISWPSSFVADVENWPVSLGWLRPCVKEVREYIVDNVTDVIARYGIDAGYFDSSSMDGSPRVNDPECYYLGGLTQLMNELYERNPGTLFCHEMASVKTLKVIPVFNLSPLAISHDTVKWHSILPSLGLFVKRSPDLVRKVFSDYAYFTGHTHTSATVPRERGGPDTPPPEFFHMEQEINDQRGIVKTIRLNYRGYGVDRESKEIIEELSR